MRVFFFSALIVVSAWTVSFASVYVVNGDQGAKMGAKIGVLCLSALTLSMLLIKKK